MLKDLWKIVLTIFLTLLAVGLILLISTRPRGSPTELIPPPSPALLAVHVSGAIIHPGVYELPASSRVQDAIELAGGFAPGADPQSLNLAAYLKDGEKITVAVHLSTAAPSKVDAAVSSQITTTSQPSTKTPTPLPLFPIDINSASAQELELLPQIGPVRSARIVAYRQTHGPFKDITDLQNVYDINPEVYAAIQDLIIAGDTPLITPAIKP